MAQHPIITSTVKIEVRENKLPILTTGRLTLRDIEVSDISDEYINWLNNPKINQFLEIRHTKQTRQLVTEFVKSKLTNIARSQHFGVYDQQGKRLIGTVTLGNIDPYHKATDISYVIGHPQAQTMGYGTEAVHAVSHYALTTGLVEKVWAGYYDGHQGSANVLAKNGYEIEGRIRKKCVNHLGERVDHILVGLLAEDYQKMRLTAPD